MATQRQTDANRRNALKSTGPRTPEGKAAVRLNSLRHGLRARTVVLPGENRQEFHQLCEDLEAEWQPQTRTEQFYLEQMAVAQWKLARIEVGEIDLFREGASADKQIPLLDRLWQAQYRLERSYARAQRELERLQNARLAQTDAAPEPPVLGAGAALAVPHETTPFAAARAVALPAQPSSELLDSVSVPSYARARSAAAPTDRPNGFECGESSASVPLGDR